MATFEFTDANGATYQTEAPDQNAAMAIFAQAPAGLPVSPAAAAQGAASAAPSDASQAPQPGPVANMARYLAMGIPFGSRLAAAGDTYLPQELGGTGKTYGENLTNEQQAAESLRAQNPGTALATSSIGALPLVAIPGGGTSTLGRIGAGALEGAVTGGLYGASSSPDLTNAGQTLPGALQGAAAGGVAGGAAPIAAQGLGRLLRSTPVDASIPTAETIGGMKDAAYEKVRSLGAAYTPESYGGLADKIAADAKAADINAEVHPKASALIQGLKNQAEEPISLTQLDQKRQVVNRDLSSSSDKGEQFFGRQIKNNIDSFIANPGEGAMAAGAAPEAAEAIQSARDLYTRSAKQTDFKDAVEHARLTAGSTNSGGNIDNATRQATRRFLESSNLTPDEITAAKRIVLGTPGQNALRGIGKFAPTGLMGGLEGLAIGDYALGGGATAAIPALMGAGGAAAKYSADRMTATNAKQLSDLILAGGNRNAMLAQQLKNKKPPIPGNFSALGAAMAAH